MIRIAQNEYRRMHYSPCQWRPDFFRPEEDASPTILIIPTILPILSKEALRTPSTERGRGAVIFAFLFWKNPVGCCMLTLVK